MDTMEIELVLCCAPGRSEHSAKISTFRHQIGRPSRPRSSRSLTSKTIEPNTRHKSCGKLENSIVCVCVLAETDHVVVLVVALVAPT